MFFMKCSQKRITDRTTLIVTSVIDPLGFLPNHPVKIEILLNP